MTNEQRKAVAVIELKIAKQGIVVAALEPDGKTVVVECDETHPKMYMPPVCLWHHDVGPGERFSDLAEAFGLAEKLTPQWLRRIDNAVRTVRNMARETRRAAAVARHTKCAESYNGCEYKNGRCKHCGEPPDRVDRR